MSSPRAVGFAFVFLGIAIGALLPIFIVVYPAVGLTPQTAGDPAALLPIVAGSPVLFVAPGVLEMAGHAVGAWAMVALWFRYGRDSDAFTAATIGGITWMAIDVLDSAISIQLVPHFGAAYVAGDSAAAAAFSVTDTLANALRLGGHFGGGLWVLGISAGLMRAGQLHRAIGWAGIFAGALLAANPLLPALLNVSFLTLPPWIVVFGIAVARTRERHVGTPARDSGNDRLAAPAGVTAT